MGLHESVSSREQRVLERALQAAGGYRGKVADLLRTNRRLLYDRVKVFGLEKRGRQGASGGMIQAAGWLDVSNPDTALNRETRVPRSSAPGS